MYALKDPKPVQRPIHRDQATRNHQSVRRVKAGQRRHPYRAIAYETTAKLTVNVLLSAVAVTALVHLLPYRSAQVGKMQELDVTLKSTSDRVQTVENRFQNYFDPYQARENMQELTDRIDPNRRRIVWQNPAPVAPAPQSANSKP